MSTRALVSPEISRRFDVLRTLLVAFVIGIHAEKGLQAYYAEMPDLLRAYLVLVPHNIFRLGVPIFFAISGYLFFLTYKPGVAAYGRMVVKKSRSIMLPYLLFNAITIGLILLFNKVPYMGDIHMVREDGFIKLLLGLYRFPAVYTLWFLRDLYVFFLTAPVYYIVAKEIPLLGIVVFWALWFFVPQAGIPVELSGAFFFYLGCVLARTGADLDAARSWLLPALGTYGALLLAAAHVEFHQGIVPVYHLLYRGSMIAGVVVVWLLSGHPLLRDNALLLRMSVFSFFVYLAHEPVLSYLIYGTRFLFHPVGAVAGIGYMCLLIAVTFALCYFLARVVSRHAPRLYALATGSR